MGVGATDVGGRLAASVGELDAVAPDFTPALDVPNGGLLCALPALLAVGLLDDVEQHLELPKGYYGLDSLLLLLAFLALGSGCPTLSRCATAPRASGASSWGWTASRRCAPCAPRSSGWRKRMRQRSGAPRCVSAG